MLPTSASYVCEQRSVRLHNEDDRIGGGGVFLQRVADAGGVFFDRAGEAGVVEHPVGVDDLGGVARAAVHQRLFGIDGIVGHHRGHRQHQNQKAHRDDGGECGDVFGK